VLRWTALVLVNYAA